MEDLGVYSKESMRVIDLFRRPFEVIDDDISWLCVFVPELLKVWPHWHPKPKGLRLDRVSMRWWKKNMIGRRIALYGALYFDEIPVLIMQRCGREGDDVMRMWCINDAYYKEAFKYILDRDTIRIPVPQEKYWDIDLYTKPVWRLHWRDDKFDRLYGFKLDNPALNRNLDNE